jgi:FkbM family methyltransferase
MPLENIESHSLLPDLVRRGGVVVDCGANLGAFAMTMIDRFGCRVLAFEASPEIFGRLPRHADLKASNVAICGQDGPVRLRLDADITRTAIAGVGRGGDTEVVVQGRALPGLLADAGVDGPIEVLKLDIEGAELEVIDSLADELISRIGQITIEFHDFLGYHSKEEVERRVARIARLGFRELFWSKSRNTGDVLLVNAERLGPVRHVFEQSLVRPVRAAGRALNRAVGR